MCNERHQFIYRRKMSKVSIVNVGVYTVAMTITVAWSDSVAVGCRRLLLSRSQRLLLILWPLWPLCPWGGSCSMLWSRRGGWRTRGQLQRDGRKCNGGVEGFVRSKGQFDRLQWPLNVVWRSIDAFNQMMCVRWWWWWWWCCREWGFLCVRRMWGGVGYVCSVTCGSVFDRVGKFICKIYIAIFEYDLNVFTVLNKTWISFIIN